MRRRRGRPDLARSLARRLSGTPCRVPSLAQ
jgi:hypothetical protein